MAYADKSKATAYKNDYAREKYERVVVQVPKGEKDNIKQAAARAGESVNNYVVRAVRARMENESK